MSSVIQFEPSFDVVFFLTPAERGDLERHPKLPQLHDRSKSRNVIYKCLGVLLWFYADFEHRRERTVSHDVFMQHMAQ